jgi:uroporphyrinogen-III synthase
MRNWQAEKTYALFSGSANKKIISEIENSGANLILFPQPEIKEIKPDTKFQNLLKNFSDFDWIVFPDVFAVDYFLLALQELGIDLYDLDAVRTCAFGETVADRLRFAQVHADLISNTVDSSSVFKALQAYDSSLEATRFLIPKEVKTDLKISTFLRESGAEIVEVPLYKTELNDQSLLSKLKALITGGAVDVFVFCAPHEIFNLAFLLSPQLPSELLADAEITATNNSTAQSLREFGFTKIKMR